MKTDNELIAEFMGIQVRQGPGVLYPCDEDGMIDWVNAEPYWPDKDWNDLMPVVEKIDKLYHETFPGNEEFIRRVLAKEEPIDGPYMNVIALPLATPITEVHQVVVSFIKWYNETKQP
jgi:hypothetical protein